MTAEHFDITVEIEDDGRCQLKLQSDTVEVNMRAAAVNFLRLADIDAASWNDRSSLQVGECAGAAVWWCSDEDAEMLMVGGDDETWDLGLRLAAGTGERIADAVQDVVG